MELKELQRNWDILGKEDPLWAIISFEDKKGNKWDVTEFFASGEQEITALMQYVSGLNLVGPRRRALDFGCGVGRLTRPLARYFSKVTGIDIAPSMIAQAQAVDREARCEFILNDRADLAIFPANEFDFIWSPPHQQSGLTRRCIRSPRVRSSTLLRRMGALSWTPLKTCHVARPMRAGATAWSSGR